MKFKGKNYVLDYVSGQGIAMPSNCVARFFERDSNMGPDALLERGPDYRMSQLEWDLGNYEIYKEIKTRSNHRNTPRKTARERAVYVINRGAMAEDIEKQIQLAVKAYAKRKANRN